MASSSNLNESELLEHPSETEKVGVTYVFQVTTYNYLPDIAPWKVKDVSTRLAKINVALVEYRSGEADGEVVRKFFEQSALANFSQNSFVLLIVRAHGTENGIILTNGDVIPYQKFVLALAKNESLCGKLKWLLFDACHGETQVSGQEVAPNGSRLLTFHTEYDVIRVHPAPSYLAYGSRFFDCFLQTIDQLTHNVTIEQFLKKFAQRVDQRCESSAFKEAPGYWSAFIRQFKLTVHQNGHAPNVQCASPWNIRYEELLVRQNELLAIHRDQRTHEQREELVRILTALANYEALAL